jgi:hypothetical protein
MGGSAHLGDNFFRSGARPGQSKSAVASQTEAAGKLPGGAFYSPQYACVRPPEFTLVMSQILGKMTLPALKGGVSSFARKLRTFGPIVLPGLNPAIFW